MPLVISRIALRPSISLMRSAVSVSASNMLASRERGDLQAVEALADFALVGGEIGQDLRPNIVRHHRAVILRLQALGKSPRQLQGLVPGAALQYRWKRLLNSMTIAMVIGASPMSTLRDLLRHIVFQHAEVARRNARE